MLPRWKKRLQRTGSVVAPQQSQGETENCAALMKVPRSLLNDWKLLFTKSSCANTTFSSHLCLNLSQNKSLSMKVEILPHPDLNHI